MSVKFRVGFTLSGETLFALIAKMLPIDDLSVEELPPAKTLAERAIAIHKITHKPKSQISKRISSGPKLTMGINVIIVEALKERPTRAIELQPKVKAGGFSPKSVNSRLEALHRAKVIEPIGDGRWRLCAT